MQWKTPYFWRYRSWMGRLLLPLSAVWWVMRRLSRLTCQKRNYPTPLIVVGSPVAGGTGKTPVVLSLLRMLENRRVFALSRGYGGKKTGPLMVDCSMHRPEDVGDEPLLLASVAQTVVSCCRTDGIRFAIGQGADIIVSDDGWQALSRVTPVLRLLVIDERVGRFNHWLIPAGPMRDSMSIFLAETDAIVAIGSIDHWLKRYESMKEKHLFTASSRMDTSEMHISKRYVAFAGLAYPEKFFDGLSGHGIIVHCESFPDHYKYQDKDMEYLENLAMQHDAVLVTTEKDAIKLDPRWKKSMVVVRMQVVFDDPDAFLNWLEGRLTAMEPLA